MRKAVEAFETDLGWRVEQVETPWGPKGPELARFFWPAHFSRHADRVAEFRDRMDPGFVACIEAGLDITMADYQKMRLVKYAYCAEIHHFFEDWDFLLTPAVSVAAFPAEQLQPDHWPQHPWDWMSWAEFSYPFNLSQVPAASIPCGFTAARPAGRAADRRPALRRSRRAADVGRVRGGAPMGVGASADCLRGSCMWQAVLLHGGSGGDTVAVTSGRAAGNSRGAVLNSELC